MVSQFQVEACSSRHWLSLRGGPGASCAAAVKQWKVSCRSGGGNLSGKGLGALAAKGAEHPPLVAGCLHLGEKPLLGKEWQGCTTASKQGICSKCPNPGILQPSAAVWASSCLKSVF